LIFRGESDRFLVFGIYVLIERLRDPSFAPFQKSDSIDFGRIDYCTRFGLLVSGSKFSMIQISENSSTMLRMSLRPSGVMAVPYINLGIVVIFRGFLELWTSISRISELSNPVA